MAITVRGDRVIFLDGHGHYKAHEACDCPAHEYHEPTRITLNEFPLYSTCSKICLFVTTLIFAFIGIGSVVSAIVLANPLWIWITFAVIFIPLALFTGLMIAVSPQMQHRFLNVEFKCRQCNQTHALLFDCITLQKRKRCGYYARDYVTLSVSDKPQTYASIEEAFGNMRDGLDKLPTGYNCKVWADDMYKSLS